MCVRECVCLSVYTREGVCTRGNESASESVCNSVCECECERECVGDRELVRECACKRV